VKSFWQKLTIGFTTSLVSLFFLVGSASALTLPVQGRLLQPSGIKVADGCYTIRFALYDQSTGGTALWDETYVAGSCAVGGTDGIRVRDSVFSARLGTKTAITDTFFADTTRTYYLGIKVGNDPEMSPRPTLGAAPAAFASTTFGGKVLNDFTLDYILSNGNTSTRAATLGDLQAQGTLTVAGAATLQSTLNVSGASTVAGLTATGATQLQSTLAVSGNTTLSGTLAVTGNTTLAGTLSVTGATTLTTTTSENFTATISATLPSTTISGLTVTGITNANGGIVIAPTAALTTAIDLTHTNIGMGIALGGNGITFSEGASQALLGYSDATQGVSFYAEANTVPFIWTTKLLGASGGGNGARLLLQSDRTGGNQTGFQIIDDAANTNGFNDGLLSITQANTAHQSVGIRVLAATGSTMSTGLVMGTNPPGGEHDGSILMGVDLRSTLIGTGIALGANDIQFGGNDAQLFYGDDLLQITGADVSIAQSLLVGATSPAMHNSEFSLGSGGMYVAGSLGVAGLLQTNNGLVLSGENVNTGSIFPGFVGVQTAGLLALADSAEGGLMIDGLSSATSTRSGLQVSGNIGTQNTVSAALEFRATSGGIPSNLIEASNKAFAFRNSSQNDGIIELMTILGSGAVTINTQGTLNDSITGLQIQNNALSSEDGLTRRGIAVSSGLDWNGANASNIGVDIDGISGGTQNIGMRIQDVAGGALIAFADSGVSVGLENIAGAISFPQGAHGLISSTLSGSVALIGANQSNTIAGLILSGVLNEGSPSTPAIELLPQVRDGVTTTYPTGTDMALRVGASGSGGLVLLGNGNLGVGDEAPISRLSVVDNASDNYVARFINNGGNPNRWGILVQAGETGGITTNTLIQFQDSSGGDVGEITFEGSTTTYGTTSDVRAKKDIVNARRGLSDVLRIPVREYRFRRDATGALHTGFIAQELDKIVPEAVAKPSSGDGLWSVDYGKLTPLLVKAVQEQQAQILTLQDQLAAQQKSAITVAPAPSFPSTIPTATTFADAVVVEGTFRAPALVMPDGTVLAASAKGLSINGRSVDVFSLETTVTDLAARMASVEQRLAEQQRQLDALTAQVGTLTSGVAPVTTSTTNALPVVGTVTVQPGEMIATVTFSTSFATTPVVILTPWGQQIDVVLSAVDAKTFTLTLPAVAAAPVQINWLAMPAQQ
jgi:hypothetical protein